MMQIELIPVLLAAVLNMIVGYTWYSPWMFGSQWSKLSGISQEAMKKKRWAPLYSFATGLTVAYFIAFFQNLATISNVSDGMLFAGLLWLGFSASTGISAVIWEGKPFKLFLINASGSLVGYLVMGGVIAS